jgi:hypothetical protein
LSQALKVVSKRGLSPKRLGVNRGGSKEEERTSTAYIGKELKDLL